MRIALLCLSPLRHDSRVLRHATLLATAGYDVHIFAQRPLPDELPCPVTPLPGPGSDWRFRLGMVLRQAPATIWAPTADLLYWASYTRLVALRELTRFAPDIIIANDWRSLPIARAVKRAGTARIIYDSHEFASEEFADSRRWNLLARQHVVRIEERYIRDADVVATVSEGIADALARRYALPERPVVVSNMPNRQIMPFRPSGDQITVLYHGAIAPRRGLEALIESVSLWPSRFRLLLRGPALGQFDERLKSLAGPLGSRVTFEPPVASHQVVAAANEADIGIFLFSNNTTHGQFALPNKIFEYMQAGLMIISSDLPEIRKIVEQTGSGLLLPDDTSASIASSLARLEARNIDDFKRASLAASQTLNFEREEKKLLDAIKRLL